MPVVETGSVPVEPRQELNGNVAGPPRWRSVRFLLSYLASAGLCVVFFQRVSLSMAIVCMVNHTAVNTPDPLQSGFHSNESDRDRWTEEVTSSYTNRTGEADLNVTSRTESGPPGSGRCGQQTSDLSSAHGSQDGPFVWDKQTQGLLLASLYVGYTVMQIPGSYVIHRRGVRVMTGGSIVVMSVCHVLCHPAALLSPWAVLTLRVVMGVASAFIIPAMYGLWARWSPKPERAQLLGITFAGQMVASAIVFPLSALLCQYGFWGGWPSIFYIFGGLGLLWSALWFYMMRDSPESHPRIQPAERDFIVCSRAAVTDAKTKLDVPWVSILRSPCFWAIAVAHFVYDWGFFLLITNLPTFLYETMDFDIQSNGVYSMLPYIALFLVLSGTGFLTDSIVKKRLLSVLTTRKIFTVVAYVTPAVLLVVMSHLQCHQAVAVVGLLVVAVGVSGLAITGGFFVNPYEVAPRYAVNICSVNNTLAAVAGIIGPYIVAAVTKDQTREQWQTVFYITAGLYLTGTVVFCLLAKAHVQPWALTSLQQPEIQILNDPPDTAKPVEASHA